MNSGDWALPMNIPLVRGRDRHGLVQSGCCHSHRYQIRFEQGRSAAAAPALGAEAARIALALKKVAAACCAFRLLEPRDDFPKTPHRGCCLPYETKEHMCLGWMAVALTRHCPRVAVRPTIAHWLRRIGVDWPSYAPSAAVLLVP